MSHSHAGRANVWFPEFWFRPARPASAGADWWHPLAEELRGVETVVDVSGSPGLWGSALRGSSVSILAWASEAYRRAPGVSRAADLVQADLIEAMCSVGRQEIDMFVLPVSGAVTEEQADGALMALEDAKQDGAIRFLALASVGPPEITLQFWQPRDGFELLILPSLAGQEDSKRPLIKMASERRVSIVHQCSFGEIKRAPREQAKLVSVGTVDEVRAVLQSPQSA